MGARDGRVETNGMASFALGGSGGSSGEVPDDGVPVSGGGEEEARVL